MTRFRTCLAIVSLAALSSLGTTAWGQSQRNWGGFRVPEAGAKLPSVQLFDEQGQPFSTDRLRGHYTVLVFGCLT